MGVVEEKGTILVETLRDEYNVLEAALERVNAVLLISALRDIDFGGKTPPVQRDGAVLQWECISGRSKLGRSKLGRNGEERGRSAPSAGLNDLENEIRT